MGFFGQPVVYQKSRHAPCIALLSFSEDIAKWLQDKPLNNQKSFL